MKLKLIIFIIFTFFGKRLSSQDLFINNYSNEKFEEEIYLPPNCLITQFIDEIGSAPQEWFDNLVQKSIQGRTREAYLAWRYLSGIEKRIHVESFNKVMDMIGDVEFIDNVGGQQIFEQICANSKARLPPATDPKLPSLVEHLENVKIVAERFHGNSTFNKLISDLTSSSFVIQDGVTHAINHIKTLPEGSVQFFDSTFPPPVACSACRYDVKFVPNEGPDGLKYIEYKSITSASSITLNQFNSYMEKIDALNEVKYVLNGSKTNLAEAKNLMKQFLITNATDIRATMTQSKFETLFGVQTAQELIDLLNDPNLAGSILDVLVTIHPI